MSDTLESLRRKITGAKELESVVRTMKVLAASTIGQYERALRSLDDYYRTVEMGLMAYFYGTEEKMRALNENSAPEKIAVVVFGSDQGLVGQFNELLTEFTLKKLKTYSCPKKIWAIGDRVHSRLQDAGAEPAGMLSVPDSVNSITAFVSNVLIEFEADYKTDENIGLYIFHNKPSYGAIYDQVETRLLPLDEDWLNKLYLKKWPTKYMPEVMNNRAGTLLALIREYLFVSIFRAAAESLASENASRLAAMQRAEKNIGELLEELNRSFNRLRQNSIDEELFDVISGFEAVTGQR